MMKKRTTTVFLLLVGTALAHAQTSPLYMISSPNDIYPMGTTYVYQNGQIVRSWSHVRPYEISIAVVNGLARQAAVYNPGTAYTLDGVPTGAPLPLAPDTYDATSDGTSIYGWNVVTATLNRYDLNWNFQQNVFSLGSSYSYGFMGVTYDPQNNSIWLSPLSTGSTNLAGYLYNYSLNGQLLGKFALASSNENGNGLAYDPADNTLWMYNSTSERYEQYSKTGNLLGTMTGMTRIYGAEFAMVPEPSAVTLVAGAALLMLGRYGSSRKN